MVIDVAGGTNRAQCPAGTRDAIVVLDLVYRLKSQILMPVIGRHPANRRGTGGLSQTRRGRE